VLRTLTHPQERLMHQHLALPCWHPLHLARPQVLSSCRTLPLALLLAQPLHGLLAGR
jgi:hypothetical protein